MLLWRYLWRTNSRGISDSIKFVVVFGGHRYPNKKIAGGSKFPLQEVPNPKARLFLRQPRSLRFIWNRSGNFVLFIWQYKEIAITNV